MREAALTLNQEPTSLEELADELIKGGFETKEELKYLTKGIAEEMDMSLKVRNMIKFLLQRTGPPKEHENKAANL
jgi:hypothetical protein